MNILISVLLFLFCAQSFGKVIITLTERKTSSGTQLTTKCAKPYQTVIVDKKLSVTANGCDGVISGAGATISQQVAQNAGYTLGELQKLMLDHANTPNPLVEIKIVSDQGQAAAVGVVTLQ